MDESAGLQLTTWNRRDLWFCVFLAVVLLLAYQGAWHGTQIFDDAIRIPKPGDRSLAALARVWRPASSTHQYHPLIDTAFWLEARLFKQRMLGYHVVNILLHATAAFLLLKILRHLAIPGACLATTIFALHPLQVESVAWLAEMKNTLSAVFLFGTLLAYLRYDAGRNRTWYWLTCLLFLVGLFAKGSTAYLPIIILLIAWWQRGRLEWQRDVRPLLPFFIMGAISAASTIWFERRMSDANSAVAIAPIDRVLIAGRAFWFYLGRIFWPVNLRMFYPRWTIDSSEWWQYLFPAAAVALFVIAWYWRQRFRWFWAALLFFFLTLVPFLGFFDVRMFRFQFVSEHFEYLPIIGIIVPISAGVAILVGRWHRWRRLIVQIAASAVLIGLTVLSWQHSEAFTDAETCYRDSIEKRGENWLVHVNLAVILIPRGRSAEAEVHLRKALELNPPETQSRSDIHLNLGQTLRQQRRFDEAIEEFEKCIEIAPNFRAYDALASVLHERGHTRAAIANYTKAMELESNSPVAPANMAWILATATDESLRDGSQALELSLRADKLSGGVDPYTLHALAAAYAETGNYPKAIETARRALRFATERQLQDLAGQLRSEITLYEIDLPVRERIN